MGGKPKAPKPTEQERPAILTTVRDGYSAAEAGSEASTIGRKKLRIDLNSAATAAPYGSSLVIPT